jgi:AcrR family transcriptional regulator
MLSDPSAPGPRSQRTRDRILQAAWDTFISEGFDRASTKRIAADAGVNSALIFRYFGSKSGLYQAAVLQPLQQQLNAFIESWESYGRSPHPATRTAVDFLGGLYDLFTANPEVAQALMTVGATAGDPGAREFSARFENLLSRVDDVVDAEAGARGWSSYNTRPTTRISFGIAFSFAMLHDLLFPLSSARPSRDEIVEGMSAYVLRSISNAGGPMPWHGPALPPEAEH